MKVYDLPASTLANLFNLTEQRIHQLAREGVIPREKGKYELVSSVQGYIKFLQDRAGGRTERRGVQSERARLTRAQAEHKELEVAALHQSLLPFDEVVAAWEQLIAAFRARCLALPSKLAPRLAVIHERKTIQNALTAEIRAALQELSGFDLAGKPAARRAQGGARGEPPAGANGKSVGRPKSAPEPRGQRRARTVPVH